MPLDKYLPPENLKVEQIIARNYGHVRYESGVNKYYWPNLKAVFSWETPEIFNDQADYYSASVACQTSFQSTATGTIHNDPSPGNAGAVSVGTYYSISGISNRLSKRVVIDADLNGNAAGDLFSVTAGYTKVVGITIKTRSNSHASFNTTQASSVRLDSNVVSVGIGINSALVLPFYFSTANINAYTESPIPVATASFATTYITNNPVKYGYVGGAPSTLTFSAATISAGSFVVTVPFRSTAESGNAPGILIPWSQSTGPDEVVNEIYKVSVLSGGSTVVSGYLSVSNIVTASSGGFSGIFSGVPTTGSYTVRIEEKRPAIYSSITGSDQGFNTTAVSYNLITAAVCCQGVSTVSVSSTMTLSGLDTAVVDGAGAITGGGIFSVSTVAIATAVSALAQDWVIQDLQINLRTRAVETSLTSIKIKPNDTAILGLLFHDGTFVMDPGITNLKLAARNSTNTAAYRVYNTDTTIVSVSNANYYRVEILANDPDLLDNQNTNLLAGSNAAQSLLGEIQWTTTRGTFSSDTFTINVPSEVVREPDV
jgi:hypothetical protein